MARGGLFVLQRPHHLEGAHAPDVAVEVAALGDRIDVGAEEDRGKGGLGSGPPAVDVGRGIDPHLEPGLLHALDQPVACGLVFAREADPRDPPFGVLAELGQAEEQVLQPAPVDVDRRRSRARERQRGRAEAGGRPPHRFFSRDGSRLRHRYHEATVR